MRGRSGRLAALAATGLLLVSACSSGSSHPEVQAPSDRHGGTMRLAVVGIDAELDPVDVVATDQSHLVVLDLLTDGLTGLDPVTEQPVPALAASWSVDGAETTWTFELNDGVMFSDGTAVTASSVVASLEHVAKHPETLAGARLDTVVGSAEFASGTSDHISGLSAPDDHTVRVTTTSPDMGLPALLASPLYGIVKPPDGETGSTETTDTTASSGTAGTKWTVGAGPFRVADRTGSLATATTLVRSDGGAAQLDSIELVREPDAGAAQQAVRDGQADWSPAPAVTPPSTGSPSVLVSPLGAEEFFGMNLASPTFANQQFRQAIVRAIDGSKVVAAGLPDLVPSAALVPTGVPGATADPCGDPCRYGPDQARYLLTQAFPDGVVPLVEVDTSDGIGDIAAANSVRDQLIAVGIPAEVKAMPFDQYRQFVTTGNQQLFRTGWVGLAPDPGAYLDPLFRSNSLDNLTSFNVPDINARLTAAAAEPDQTKRSAAYGAIETTILGLSPVVPLGSYRSSVVLASTVQDYAQRLDSTFDVEQVWVGTGTTATTG